MKIVLDEGAVMPTRAHRCDAGLDLYAAERKVIRANDWEVIETGVHVQIPQGFFGLLTSKSGLMANHGLTSRGTIDSNYTGSIKAVLFNHSKKVTQMIILKHWTPDLKEVDRLKTTDRGNDGFGSTGR